VFIVSHSYCLSDETSRLASHFSMSCASRVLLKAKT